MCTHNKGKLMNPKCFMHTAAAQIYSFLANPCGNNCSGSVDTWVIDFKWGNPQRGLNWHIFFRTEQLVKGYKLWILKIVFDHTKNEGVRDSGNHEGSFCQEAKSIRLWCVLEQSTMFQETLQVFCWGHTTAGMSRPQSAASLFRYACYCS